jgi:hypothetical protein
MQLRHRYIIRNMCERARRGSSPAVDDMYLFPGGGFTTSSRLMSMEVRWTRAVLRRLQAALLFMGFAVPTSPWRLITYLCAVYAMIMTSYNLHFRRTVLLYEDSRKSKPSGSWSGAIRNRATDLPGHRPPAWVAVLLPLGHVLRLLALLTLRFRASSPSFRDEAPQTFLHQGLLSTPRPSAQRRQTLPPSNPATINARHAQQGMSVPPQRRLLDSSSC